MKCLRCRKLLPILIAFILMAPASVGCGQPYTLAVHSITGGNVSVQKAGTTDWIEAEIGMSIEEGDIIMSGSSSGAEIMCVDGTTIELEAGTEIQVASLATTGTGSTIIVLKQIIGTIIFRITKVIDPESRYEILTPVGAVAARGSAMQVTVTEDGTTQACNLEGDIWAIAQGVELQIPEGRCCFIRPGEPPELIGIFADPNLEAAIREAIGKPTGDIYLTDLEGLVSLVAGGRNIENLAGLEYCTSLIYLGLNGNQISDISPLAGLTGLMWLYLGANEISNISPLAGLINLTDLRVEWNHVIDISGLTNLTSLTFLELRGNQIGSAVPLAGLTSLTHLDLGSNQIADVSPLSSLTDLTNLLLFQNEIFDISALANLTSLTSLMLDENSIIDVSPLAGLTGLRSLELVNNQVSNITPLSGLTNLASLWLAENEISDISPLGGLMGLAWLQLSYNDIEDISALADLTNLEGLELEYNQIGDISAIGALTNLWYVELRSNQISDVSPLVDNAGLGEGDEVYLYTNPLSSDSINVYIPQLQTRGVIVYY